MMFYRLLHVPPGDFFNPWIPFGKNRRLGFDNLSISQCIKRCT